MNRNKYSAKDRLILVLSCLAAVSLLAWGIGFILERVSF